MSSRISNPIFEIEHKFSSKNELIYDRDHFTGYIFTKLLVFKKYTKVKGCLIPTWLRYLLGLLFALLLATMIAALVILLKKPAQHKESCSDRSCEKNLGLHCIDKTCQCLTNQYYLGGCKDKKTYSELCFYDYQCSDNTNMLCIGGACTCNVTMYWNGKKCVQRKNLYEPCTGDQCLTTLMLFCNSVTKKCECDWENRFWDLSVCVLKRTFTERCTIDNECDSRKGLLCFNGTCGCTKTYGVEYYFDTILDKCTPCVNYTRTCGADNQCKQLTENTECINGKCDCPRVVNNEWYWNGSYCVPALIYNSTCTNDIQCQYLTQKTSCIDGQCQCVKVYSNETYWRSSTSECEPANVYSTSCTNNITCQTITQNTLCLNNKCECYRVFGNESYFNGSYCVPALTNGSQCTKDEQCQYMTQLTKCYSGICSCGTNGAFNSATSINKCYFCPTGSKIYTMLTSISCFRTVTTDIYSNFNKSCIAVGGSFVDVVDLAMFNFLQTVSPKGFVAGVDDTSGSYVTATTGCLYIENGLIGTHNCNHGNHGGYCEIILF